MRLQTVTIALLLLVIGCAKPRPVSKEEIKQIQVGMTLAEVEKLLGPGASVPKSSLVGPGIVQKQWGDKDGTSIVNFFDGKVLSVANVLTPEQTEAMQKEREAKDEAQRQADDRDGMRRTTPIMPSPPGMASRLTQTATFDRYQISLTPDFSAQPPKSVGGRQIFTWTGPSAGREPIMLLVMVSSDERMLAEAKAGMRKALVNFSAGTADSLGIRISSRESTQYGTIGGVAFSGFEWFGKVDVGAKMGYVYGGIDGNQAIAIFGSMDPASKERPNELGLIRAIVASFKKQ